MNDLEASKCIAALDGVPWDKDVWIEFEQKGMYYNNPGKGHSR